MAANHLGLVQQLAAKFPELLAGVNDDARREFTRRVAQTLKARFPAEGWAHKRASATRPPSKDAIVDGAADMVDILTGAATDHPVPCWRDAGPLGGQVRIEVPAKDWLAAAPVPEPEPDPDPEPEPAPVCKADDVVRVLTPVLADLAARLAALEAAVRAIPAPAPGGGVPPVYDVSISVPYLGTAKGTATPKQG